MTLHPTYVPQNDQIPHKPSSQIPFIPQMPHIPELPMPQYTGPNTVSYEEIYDLLFPQAKVTDISPPFVQASASISPQSFSQPFTSTPSSFLTPHYPTYTMYQPPRSIQPTQVMGPQTLVYPYAQPYPTQQPFELLNTVPQVVVASHSVHTITLATPVPPYPIDPYEAQSKRLKTNSYPLSSYRQSLRHWRAHRGDYPDLPCAIYSVPPAPEPIIPLIPLVLPPAEVVIPPISPTQVKQIQADLVAHTLAIAQKQAEVLRQTETLSLAEPDQGESVVIHDADTRMVVAEPENPVPQPTKIEPSSQSLCSSSELDLPGEKSELTFRPWQSRRLRRNSTQTTSSDEAQPDEEKGEEPLKSELSPKSAKAKSVKFIVHADTAKSSSPIKHSSKKRRFYKSNDKDEDYDEDELQEEEEEDDDEEYEAPLRSPRRRRKPSSRHSGRSTSCLCKICTAGIPASVAKPPSWVDIVVLSLNCLGQLSRIKTKCFNLKTEIFPFVEKHYSELVPTNERNNWKQKIQKVLAAPSDEFVCVKEDKASGISQLWALREERDMWATTMTEDSDYDSDESSDFETEMANHMGEMRAQLHEAYAQRDKLKNDLVHARENVKLCTAALYTIVDSCAAVNSAEVGAKLFDDIFEGVFEDIRQILGEYAEHVLDY